MADYRLADDTDTDHYLAGFILPELEKAKDGRGALATWAQDQLTKLVAHGYIVPTAQWKVWDAKAGAYTDPDYATKDLALAARRELGGNSARYRVERVPLAEAVTE